MGRPIVICTLAAAVPTAALAQDPGQADRTGFYAGIEAGAVEHHFYLTETDSRTGSSRGQYYRTWGPGAGVFAGYDFALAARTNAGVEVSALTGGRTNQARLEDGDFYRASPRYGYRLVGWIGQKLGARATAYVSAGYGGHEYRVEAIGVANPAPSGSSFIVGGGAAYRITPRVALRVDFKHLDNQSHQLLVGLPVRF